MKKIYIIIVCLLISFITMYVLFHASIIQPYTPSKENKREQQTNTISYGLKDKANILTTVVKLLVRIIQLTYRYHLYIILTKTESMD